MDSRVTMMPVIDASEIPEEVEEWLKDYMCIYLHDQCTYIKTDDDGSPLVEFFKELGIEPDDNNEFKVIICD